jgi:hypothetical protein
MKTKTTCLLIASAVLLVSCGEKSTQSTAEVSVSETSPALSAVLAATPAGEAASIAAIRTTAKPGDEVTISGQIMGNSKPFVDGRAAFILGDPDVLTPCNEVPGDECETPWDVCCDSPEDKKRGTATIQIVDADGRVLKESIEGVGGLQNLAKITVTGKVAEGSSADLLIVNASAIKVSASVPGAVRSKS